MSAPLTENDLFGALRGYASTLEVQYMIEEEVKKFQEKVLPRLLTEALAAKSPAPSTTATTARDANGAGGVSDAPANNGQAAGAAVASSPLRLSSSSPSASPVAGVGLAAPHTPDAEWAQTFIKAHVEDALSRCLPTMIAAEVQRQLRGASDAAAAVVAAARSRVGLPPLPPSPPRPPLAPPRDGTAATAPAADAALGSSLAHTHHRDADGAPAQDEGRRQRERILGAIADIEHQVNGMQRELNVVLQQQQRTRCRLESLCDALEPPAPAAPGHTAGAAETASESLCTALERALDEREVSVVRTRLATALVGLLPAPAPAPPPPSARPTLSANASATDAMESSGQWPSVSHATVVSLLPPTPPATGPIRDGPPRLSLRSPARLHRDPGATSPLAAPLASGPAFLNTVAPRVSSPLRSPSQTSPSPPAVPPFHAALSSSVTARTLDFARTDAAATTAAAVLPARPVRAITTRGAARDGASSAVAASLPQSVTTSPSPPPALRRPTRLPSDDASAAAAAAAAAAAPPTLTPRERTGSDTRGRATTAAAATGTTAPPRRTSQGSFPPPLAAMRGSPTKLSGSPLNSPTRPRGGRAVVLGVDAVNIPAGMLPGALGRQGAVRVQSVAARQLAERAGIYRGDVLLSVDRRAVRSCEELRDVLAAVPLSQSAVAVELYRHTAHQIITVTLRL